VHCIISIAQILYLKINQKPYIHYIEKCDTHIRQKQYCPQKVSYTIFARFFHILVYYLNWICIGLWLFVGSGLLKGSTYIPTCFAYVNNA